VGNAAGTGARQKLLSPDARIVAGEIFSRVQYIELTTNEGFKKVFMQVLNFDVPVK
jgi:uncharacterized 2Fe-2S/4Fe-4S cluster protein (DUF4445 family)